MKKQIIALSVMLASALSLTNCAKEELVPATPSEGTPFSLTASIADTKTANDGLKTTWVADDAINLFHAAAGTTAYVNDGSFTVSDVETGKFDGTLAGELTAESYDWYAFYPYSNYIKAPDGSAGYWPLGHAVTGTAYPLTATQQGNDNTAHLAGQYMPLYATATVSASEQVSLNFKNLASVVKIIITNTVDEPLIASSVKFTSTEDIVGTFKYDLTSEPVKYESSGTNYTGPTASLTVENGTAIAKGASAAFYIPVKPHIAANGSTLKISVNGYEKTLELPKDVTFTAGSIKPLKFDYDKAGEVDYVTIPWSEDFSGDLGKYILTNGGTTTKIFEESSAGGTSPELLVSKDNGSFAVKIKALQGNYALSFKSNHADYLEITADNGVVVDGSYASDKKSANYTLNIPANVTFTLTFKNTNTNGNTRLDDISIVAILPTLAAPTNLICTVQTDNSLTFTWNTVSNAVGYQVSLDGGKTYGLTQLESTYTWEDLPSGTTKTLFLKAIGDGISYNNSEAVSAEGTTTGDAPEIGYEDDGTLATWTFTQSSKPANNIDFVNNGASDKYTECTFNLNGSGSTWNTGAGKGYAFTAVTDITITIKAEKKLKKGAKLTLSMDTFFNKATNAPMKGFDITVREGTGTASTTGCDVTSWTLSNSSANKIVTYTLQNDVEMGDNVSFILTQTGKAGAGQGYVNNVKAEYKN